MVGSNGGTYVEQLGDGGHYDDSEYHQRWHEEGCDLLAGLVVNIKADRLWCSGCRGYIGSAAINLFGRCINCWTLLFPDADDLREKGRAARDAIQRSLQRPT